mgnify:CR=1 FL=1
MEILKIKVGHRYLIKEGHELHRVLIEEKHIDRDGNAYWICSDGNIWMRDHFILSFTVEALHVIGNDNPRGFERWPRLQDHMDIRGRLRRTTDNQYTESMFTYCPE